MLTQEQNLVIQTYLSFCLTVELKNNEFFTSEYFQNMNFDDPWVKKYLKEIGIDNRGTLLMALYAMLVVPKELVGKAYELDYSAINDWIALQASNTKTTYAKDTTQVDHIRHLRNATAHASIEVESNSVVRIKDRSLRVKQDEQFSTDFPLSKIGELLSKLQRVHIKYIDSLQK